MFSAVITRTKLPYRRGTNANASQNSPDSSEPASRYPRRRVPNSGYASQMNPASGLTYQAKVAIAQKSATRSAGRCSWFFSSKLNGSRPMSPGQPKPVTKIPAATTAISARAGGAWSGAFGASVAVGMRARRAYSVE